MCLFLDFIHYNTKKKKNKKTKQKYKGGAAIFFFKQSNLIIATITYFESQYIPFNLLKMKIELWLKITRKKQEMF